MDKIEIRRTPFLAPRIVIVDGQPGCGKTLFGPIIAAMPKVELLNYAYPIEYTCALAHFEKIDADAAIALVRMYTDLQLYNNMLGREVNVRPGDLSGIWMNPNPWRYIQRMMMPSHEALDQRIREQQPILNLTTHNLLGIAQPVFDALGERLIFVEIIRHPLYQIKQQDLNNQRLLNNPRDFTVYMRYQDQEIPFWAESWKDKYVSANSMDRSIYAMQACWQMTEAMKKKSMTSKVKRITIPFEQFVLDPWPWMNQLAEAMGVAIDDNTRRAIARQKVPRTMIANGINSKLYKYYGWQKAQTSSEREELSIRRGWAEKAATAPALAVLDQLSSSYEKEFMSGILTKEAHV